MNKTIKYAAFAGIVSLIAVIPTIVLEVIKGRKELSGLLLTSYIAFALVVHLVDLVYFWGFKIIGEKTKNKILLVSAYILLVFTVFSFLQVVLEQFFMVLDNIIIGVLILIVFGAIHIPFGIGILKLKKQFGGIATAAGVMTIITGASFLTFILSFIGLILLIPMIILHVVLLFKAAKKLK